MLSVLDTPRLATPAPAASPRVAGPDGRRYFAVKSGQMLRCVLAGGGEEAARTAMLAYAADRGDLALALHDLGAVVYAIDADQTEDDGYITSAFHAWLDMDRKGLLTPEQSAALAAIPDPSIFVNYTD